MNKLNLALTSLYFFLLLAVTVSQAQSNGQYHLSFGQEADIDCGDCEGIYIDPDPTGNAFQISAVLPDNEPTVTVTNTPTPTATVESATPTSEPTTTVTDTPTETPVVINPTVEPPTTEVSWSMAGSNLERTSYVPSAPNPRENDFGVKWYRPVEAYIGQHVQLVTGRGKVFVSTAAGLYALDAQTGSEIWRFNTAMPLGHSPTLDNTLIFVGGSDGRVYALNADTGQLVWEFDEAKAGYSSNPLVLDNSVLIGSRDGRFYSISRSVGSLQWVYPPLGQEPLGPIMFSPAYKNGKVYFASNNNRAYALETENGQLVWESEILPGDGYQAFWPVIYQNYVIFSAAPAYAESADPGTRSFPNNGFGVDYIKTIQRDDVYPNGGAVTGEGIAEYLEEKPWRRSVVALDINTGEEFTTDLDSDGKPEYPPFMYVGTKSGNRYPVVVANDKVYGQNLVDVRTGWNISRASLVEWDIQTGQISPVGLTHAIDEPFADSVGGNMVYSNLCCDRIGAYFSLGSGPSGEIWNYGRTLESVKIDNPLAWQYSLAPGYDMFWWESSMWSGLPRLTGYYGGPNGIYHNHTVQNPMVPYGDMVFTHRSNAIIALGPDSIDLPRINDGESPSNYEARIRAQYPSVSLQPLYKQSADLPLPTITEQDVLDELNRQIELLLDAGHLRPGYYNGTRAYREWMNVHENPGETLYTLSLVYPHVDETLKDDLKVYIDQHFDMYFDGTAYSRTGYQNLAQREWMPTPPEVQTDMNNTGPSTNWLGQGESYPQFNMYALWLYAQNVHLNNQAQLDKIYTVAKNRVSLSLPSSTVIREQAWVENNFIAGYTGFLKLQTLAGFEQVDAALRSDVNNNLNTVLANRVNNFEKDQPFVEVSRGGDYYKRSFNTVRNLIGMTPELGQNFILNNNLEVQNAVEEYQEAAPYWLFSRYEASTQEMSNDNSQTHTAMFRTKAFVENANQAELMLYLDAPVFAVGDMFYIAHLGIILDQ